MGAPNDAASMAPTGTEQLHAPFDLPIRKMFANIATLAGPRSATDEEIRGTYPSAGSWRLLSRPTTRQLRTCLMVTSFSQTDRQTYLSVRYSLMPYFDPSRPMPEHLTPPKGCFGSRDQACVHANHSIFECLRYRPHAAQIARMEVRGETEFGIFGHFDHVLDLVEGKQWRNRPERLLSRQAHFGSRTRQYSRFVEQLSGRVAPAARHHVRAFRDGIGDMGLDLRKRGPGNQRSDLNSSLPPVADLQSCYRSGELGREGVLDVALNIDAVGADAGLPRIAELWR